MHEEHVRSGGREIPRDVIHRPFARPSSEQAARRLRVVERPLDLERLELRLTEKSGGAVALGASQTEYVRSSIESALAVATVFHTHRVAPAVVP